MEPPYPEYPPSYLKVEEMGGYKRTCVVIEVLSSDQLTTVELAHIKEQLEATTDAFKRRLASVERTQVVMPNRFDPILRAGLRI